MKLYLFSVLSTVLLSISLIQAKLAMFINAAEGDKDNLYAVGLARAKCLCEVFGVNGTLTTPQKIYAQTGKSLRFRDTVMPLAQSLNLEVDLTYNKENTKELINGIISAKEDVSLISWSPNKMDKVTKDFQIVNPPTWDSNNYDNIWILTDGAIPYLKNENSTIQATTYKGSRGYGMIVVKENVEQCMKDSLPAGADLLTTSSGFMPKAHITTIFFILLLILIVF
jgi:hypothetical protein